MTPTRLPAESYTDPSAYLEDLKAIFSTSWLIAGHDGMIPAGHVVARQIGKWHVLLTRDPNGVLRAFHNVCRHRAGPLFWPDEAAVKCRVIRCRYHAWTYDWDGSLLATPGFGEELPFEDLSLHGIQCEEHAGLIWLHLGTPFKSVKEEKSLLFSVLESLRSFELHSQASHSLGCSWKVYAENYLEGYHIPAMHPKLVRSVKMSSYRVEVHNGYVTHHVKMRSKSVHNGFWAFVWPNTAINIYGRGASIERIVPVSESETRIEYQYLFLPGVSPSEKAETIAESELLTLEDKKICEAVQKNLASGVYEQGYLAPDQERGVQAFQEWVLEAHGRL